MKLRRIFVKSVNWIGDAVLVTPTLRVLRRAFPDAHITLLARPRVAPVFEANPDIDQLWTADENKSMRWFREIAARIRREKFDLGIALPNSFGSALLLALGGIRQRIGYSRDGRRLLLNNPVPLSPEILQVHQVEYYLNLLRAICDIEKYPRELVVLPAEGAEEQVRRILEKHGLQEALSRDIPLAAIAPGAAYGTAKRWFPERFAALADHLAERWGARVLIVGTREELDVAREIAGRVKHPVAILNEDLPLRGLIALCGRLRLFLTNDSGGMHVAAARGTPLVAVFGPTDRVTTAPYHARAILVHRDVSCPDNPCLQRHCSREHACMKAVTVEDVMTAVDRQMGEN